MEQDKIITIDEFLSKCRYEFVEKSFRGNFETFLDKEDVKEVMIKAIKYHTKLALKAASKKIILDAQEQYGSSIPDCWSIDSILNAYNEDLIK